MANEKISEYTDTAVAIADTDLFDISVDQGAGVFQTEKITGLSLKTALATTTIYTGNASLTGNRQVDLGGFNLSFTGTTSFIGIGIIAASPFRLHIASLVNEDPLRVDTNSSNNALTIIDDGADSLVGIGTGAASENLHNVGNTRLDGNITRNVSSASALSSVHFANDSTDGLTYQVSAAGNFSAPSIGLFRTRGTIAAPTVVLRDDILGEFSVSPYNGTAPYKSASMRMIATEFHSGALGGTAIHWTTTANLGIINTVKMALDHNGNLGVNTTAPVEKLHVVGSIRMADGNQAAGRVMVSDVNGTGTWTDFGGGIYDGSGTIIGGLTSITMNTDSIRFFSTGNSQLLRLDGVNGRIGMGTASPARPLHLVGSGAQFDFTATNDGLSIKDGSISLFSFFHRTTGGGMLVFDETETTVYSLNHSSGDDYINTGKNFAVGNTGAITGSKFDVIGGNTSVRFDPATLTDNSTLNSPLIRARGYYDSDAGAGITGVAWDFDIEHTLLTTTPTSKAAFKFNGVEKLTILNNGSLGLLTTAPNASALLDMTSTTQGFAPPSMTGAQVEAIASPKTSLLVYATSAGAGDVTTAGWWGWNATNWIQLG